MWVFSIGVIIGVLSSGIVSMLFIKRFMVGTLRIDRSDPDDQPYMFLELSKNTSDLANKAYVILKVSTENYISQK